MRWVETGFTIAKSFTHIDDQIGADQSPPAPLAIALASLAGFGANVAGAGSVSLYCELTLHESGIGAAICDVTPGLPILIALLAPVVVVAAGRQARKRHDPFLFHICWVSTTLLGLGVMVTTIIYDNVR